jgi:DNA replication protein DnaC
VDRPASPALDAERKQRAVVECQILRRQSGVPGRYADVDLTRCPRVLPEKYHAMAGVLLRVIDRPCLIAIGGEPGTGKTALACGLVNAYCGRGRSARYARAQKFLNELGDAPWGTGAKQRIRERYAAADLLVLDEIQSTQDGQVWLDELEYLIDERYGRFTGEGDDRRTFATVLIGNLTAEALQDRLGRRVWRRLDEEGGFFEAAWEPVYPILLTAGLAR